MRQPVIFVSYARSDRELADRLVAALKRAGHDCWLDTSDIPGGEVWLAAIADGIECAYAVVSVVSAAANASEWVRLEYLHAKKRGKHILPLLAGDCEPPWYMADRRRFRSAMLTTPTVCSACCDHCPRRRPRRRDSPLSERSARQSWPTCTGWKSAS